MERIYSEGDGLMTLHFKSQEFPWFDVEKACYSACLQLVNLELLKLVGIVSVTCK